jgi:hypothetical protein
VCTAAREILAISTLEVNYKRLFNKGRDLLGIRRYAMSEETMRIMMPLKGALRSKKEMESTAKSTTKGPDTLNMLQRRNQ